MGKNRRIGFKHVTFEIRGVTYDDRKVERLGNILDTAFNIEEARFKATKEILESGSSTYEVEIHKTSREVVEVYDKLDVLEFFKKPEIAPPAAPPSFVPAFSDAGPAPSINPDDDEIPF